MILEHLCSVRPFESGGRLPLGRIRLVIEVPGYFPMNRQQLRWLDAMGRRDGHEATKSPLVPDGFIGSDDNIEDEPSLNAVALDEPPPEAKTRSNLPYWIAGGLGGCWHEGDLGERCGQ